MCNYFWGRGKGFRKYMNNLWEKGDGWDFDEFVEHTPNKISTSMTRPKRGRYICCFSLISRRNCHISLTGLLFESWVLHNLQNQDFILGYPYYNFTAYTIPHRYSRLTQETVPLELLMSGLPTSPTLPFQRYTIK